MKTLSLVAHHRHKVACGGCGYERIYDDAPAAVQDYRRHSCGEHECGRDHDPGCDGCRVAAGDAGGEF